MEGAVSCIISTYDRFRYCKRGVHILIEHITPHVINILTGLSKKIPACEFVRFTTSLESVLINTDDDKQYATIMLSAITACCALNIDPDLKYVMFYNTIADNRIRGFLCRIQHRTYAGYILMYPIDGLLSNHERARYLYAARLLYQSNLKNYPFVMNYKMNHAYNIYSINNIYDNINGWCAHIDSIPYQSGLMVVFNGLKYCHIYDEIIMYIMSHHDVNSVIVSSARVENLHQWRCLTYVNKYCVWKGYMKYNYPCCEVGVFDVWDLTNSIVYIRE